MFIAYQGRENDIGVQSVSGDNLFEVNTVIDVIVITIKPVGEVLGANCQTGCTGYQQNRQKDLEAQ